MGKGQECALTVEDANWKSVHDGGNITQSDQLPNHPAEASQTFGLTPQSARIRHAPYTHAHHQISDSFILVDILSHHSLLPLAAEDNHLQFT